MTINPHNAIDLKANMLSMIKCAYYFMGLLLFAPGILWSQLPVASSTNPNEPIKALIKKADSLKYALPDTSILYYQKALELAIIETDTSKITDILNQIGGAYYILGDYFQALNYFTESFKLSQLIGYSKGIATGYNNIGIIFCVQNKIDQSIAYHKNSIAICAELKDSLLMQRNLFNLGISYSSAKNYDSALHYATLAQEICDQINYPREKMRIYNLLGEIHFDRGDFKKALSCYTTVVNDKQYDNKWEHCYALSGIGRASLQLGHPDTAIKYGLLSKSLANEINALWDLQRIHSLLSEAYATQGHFEEAFNHHVTFKLLSDSIFNQEKESEINYLLFLQEQLENEQLQHAFDLQQEEIKKQNFLSRIYIFFGMALLLLAYLLWRNLRLKSRLNNRLKASNSIIESKNKELTRLNATKDRFFHMVAHDLKSPLSSMISFTDLLQTRLDQFDEAQIKEFLKSLHQSSSQGFKLLENLLDWARLQSNSIVYKPDKLKVYPLVDNTLQLLESNAKSKDIRIKVEIDHELTAIIDRNMLLTVLRNLVSNAIKYSHVGSEINIQAEELNESVFIRVKDNGIGIPEDMRAKLFNIETYVSRPGTNHEDGTGIGLVLCHDFIKKWGGTISVESTEGKGSCFTISLPAV